MPKRQIHVAGGIADYFTTEEEDNLGHWNDNYSINQGFWVLHEGRKHHVYKER